MNQPGPSNTGRLKVVFNRVEAYNNAAHGIGLVSGWIAATATDSVAANNGFSGFVASDGATLIVLRSLAALEGFKAQRLAARPRRP